jgi:Protein of unknown function (DUF3445)
MIEGTPLLLFVHSIHVIHGFQAKTVDIISKQVQYASADSGDCKIRLACRWMKSIPMVMYRSVRNRSSISKYLLVYGEPGCVDREKLETSLERFFKRLPVDKPVIRNNYFFQIVRPYDDIYAKSQTTPYEYTDLDPEELAWSLTANGPEDDFNPGNGVHSSNSCATPFVSPSTLHFRTERQTLRRLPKSGAILFTIRTYVSPVTELGKERGIPARMASAIRSWPADVAKYKALALYENVLLGYLDECARIQVEKGEVGEGERMKAEYPF